MIEKNVCKVFVVANGHCIINNHKKQLWPLSCSLEFLDNYYELMHILQINK